MSLHVLLDEVLLHLHFPFDGGAGLIVQGSTGGEKCKLIS